MSGMGIAVLAGTVTRRQVQYTRQSVTVTVK